MPVRAIAAFFYMLALTAASGEAARAQGTDPHDLYEQRCAGCHEAHAGDFVPDSLERRGDRIVGRKNGKELRAFLAAGHGRLAPGEVDAMVTHLAYVLETSGLFRKKCLICHERAVVLARGRLILRDDRLTGRYTGRDIPTFMENHGRLEGDEVATIVRMLERQLTLTGSD